MILKALSKFVKIGESHKLKKFNLLYISKRAINLNMHQSNKESIQTGSAAMHRISNIIKSQQDQKEYRGLKLENGMKVLLVSDPTTDISAASMAVQVGYYSDPDDIPGLAHFCEHMLFLGTEKYQDENAYSTYLSQNGGSTNATTYATTTKFFFSVAPDKLEGALDRFAQFFISPLFTESATDREINAVNSEHEKNLAMDIWRVRQVSKYLADPTHPYSKFGTGNKFTLDENPKLLKLNIRDELMKFHKKWYSSNIMCLAVFGKESLNELEQMVVSMFSQVENKHVDLPIWPDEPHTPDSYPSKVLITPVKDIRSLTISFTTEDLTDFYKSSPDQYVSHLIGHEGKGSIQSTLRQKGWCNDLLAGQNNTSRGFGFFEVSVDLTKDGFEHVDEIIELIFQYIKLIKEEGPQKWIFEECCNLNEMLFRFKDKDFPLALVSNVVHAMQVYPMEEVLSAPYLVSEWRPDLIEKLVNKFDPKKCRIIVVEQSLEPLTTNVEPWYKTKYIKQSIPPQVIERWENCSSNDQLKLPTPNPFIPTDFNILPEDPNTAKHPVIILDSPVIRVWHKQDTEFLKPKTCMNFDFSNPMVYTDPLNCNLTHMLVVLFKDQLNEYLYEADLAGLKFHVVNTTSGISVIISGYSDKQLILLEKVLDHLFDFKIDEQRFEILKEQHLRSLKNFKAEAPYQHAIYYLALILTENAWSKAELLEAMELVTLERLKHFIREFFSRLHTECFIYGNANKKKALEVSELIKKKLEGTNSVMLPLLSRQLLLRREYKLGAGESFLFEINNDVHKSSCTELYLQCGKQTDTAAVFIDLIAQILTEPCYTELRTKEQLGYIVHCGSRKVNGATGIRFIVQSAKHPSFVEERIENFLEKMESTIQEMPAEEFQQHKDSLATNKLEKPKKLVVMFHTLLSEITKAQYHFERSEAEVAILNNITQAELVDYYKTYISKKSGARQALSVYVISNADSESPQADDVLNMYNEINQDVPPTIPDDLGAIVQSSESTERIKINDLAAFKSSKELYASARPFLDIRPKGARSKL